MSSLLRTLKLPNVTFMGFFRFTRHEFSQGCRSLRADSIRTLQARLPDAAVEANATPELFKVGTNIMHNYLT